LAPCGTSTPPLDDALPIFNGRDAMPAGGLLEITLSGAPGWPDAASTQAGGSHVRLCVRDNGAGIEPEVLPHVFEPFFTTKPLNEDRKRTRLNPSHVKIPYA